jgi:hypothetical protein
MFLDTHPLLASSNPHIFSPVILKSTGTKHVTKADKIHKYNNLRLQCVNMDLANPNHSVTHYECLQP